MIKLIASARDLASHWKRPRTAEVIVLAPAFWMPAHGHAHVLALKHRDDPARIEPLHQQVGDLGGQALLHLRAARVDLDEPRELGQPGDPAVLAGDVADVRHPVERQEVVLAE